MHAALLNPEGSGLIVCYFKIWIIAVVRVALIAEPALQLPDKTLHPA